MSLARLITALAPTRLEEIRRNRKAVLWRCWHGAKLIGYRVAGINGDNARAFCGGAAMGEARDELKKRGRK